MNRSDLEPEIKRSFRSGDIRHYYGDGSKLASLGWKSRVSLENGFRELVEWTAQAEAVDMVEKAHEELVAKGLVRD